MKKYKILVILLLITFTLGCSNNKDNKIKEEVINYSISKSNITKEDSIDRLDVLLEENNYDYAYSLLDDISNKIKELKPKNIAIDYKLIYKNNNTIITLDKNGLSKTDNDKLKQWIEVINLISKYEDIYIDNWYIIINNNFNKVIINDIVINNIIKTIKISYDGDFDFYRLDSKTIDEVNDLINNIDYDKVKMITLGL